MVRRWLYTKTFPSFSFSVAEGFITHASKGNSLFLGGNRSHAKPSGEYIASYDTQLLRLYLMTYFDKRSSKCRINCPGVFITFQTDGLEKNWQTKERLCIRLTVSARSGVSRLFQNDSPSGHEKMRATEALIADTLTTISARFELAQVTSL